MKAVLFRYATPLITGLFFISLISGVSLFVHVGQGYFRSMHEILSMVLIAPFALHLWRNWRAWANYFSRGPMMVASVLSLILAGGFVYQASSNAAGGVDGPPQFALVKALEKNSVAQMAPLLGYSPESLVARLKARGFAGAAAELSLADVAKAAGEDDFALAAALQPEKQ